MFGVHFNQPADFAARQASIGNTRLTQALERLSSGYRINRASDDAAGLALSEKLRAQVRGLTVASTNIQTAISLVQSAEAGIAGLTDILQRMRELAVQAGNATFTNTDRNLMQLEVDQLLNEINRMMTATQFNKMKLLDGTFATLAPGTPKGVTPEQVKAGNSQFTVKDYDASRLGVQLPSGSVYQGSLVFHVGGNATETLKISISTISAQALGLTSLFSSAAAVIGNFFTKPVLQGVPSTPTAAGADQVLAKGIQTAAFAQSAIVALDSAITNIGRRRAQLGAFENELRRRFDFVGAIRENIATAESRIRDTDMAEEVINFTSSQIVVQAATAMLGQANLQKQTVLALLG